MSDFGGAANPPLPDPSWHGPGDDRPVGPPLAGAGARIVARAIDVLLTMFVGLAAAALLLGTDTTDVDDLSTGMVAVLVAIPLAWTLATEVVLTAVKGGSMGKLVLGLRVVRRVDRRPVGLATSAVRWSVPGAFVVAPVIGGYVQFGVWLVGIVLLFTDTERRTLGDRLAGTVVLTTRPMPMSPLSRRR